jgi:thymidylate synthase
MRSNDVIWGMCYDVFFVTMLQELMAKTLRLELGTYSHFTGSIHAYEYHWTMLNEIASKDIPPLVSVMPEMEEIEALPLFLKAEEMLRHHHPDALKNTYALPGYWRKLAEPLIEKHNQSFKSRLD